jgi:hypothetical protein
LAGAAQTVVAIDITDPFIATIADMKRSVAPLVCLQAQGKGVKVLKIAGSAVFIASDGEFLTAAHVLQGMDGMESECPITAILLPSGGWQPGAVDEVLAWFPFKLGNCIMSSRIDIAKCRPAANLSDPSINLSWKIMPARFEYSKQPDGTQVAMTGFPLSARDPMTSRAAIATHRTLQQNDGKLVSELILDRTAWPGGSGSPVYLSGGLVIGIVVAKGVEEGTGVAVVRPSESLRELLSRR